jgi:hypothetical protein
MARKLTAASVQNWFADFLHMLAGVRRAPLPAAPRPIGRELTSRKAPNSR